MTRPPDRLLNTVRAAQVGSALKTLAPGGRQTLRARPIRVGTTGTPQITGGFAVVNHGDDGTVMRPAVQTVMWVGAATPLNGIDYDMWYPADV